MVPTRAARRSPWYWAALSPAHQIVPQTLLTRAVWSLTAVLCDCRIVPCAAHFLVSCPKVVGGKQGHVMQQEGQLHFCQAAGNLQTFSQPGPTPAFSSMRTIQATKIAN